MLQPCFQGPEKTTDNTTSILGINYKWSTGEEPKTGRTEGPCVPEKSIIHPFRSSVMASEDESPICQSNPLHRKTLSLPGGSQRVNVQMYARLCSWEVWATCSFKRNLKGVMAEITAVWIPLDFQAHEVLPWIIFSHSAGDLQLARCFFLIFKRPQLSNGFYLLFKSH